MQSTRKYNQNSFKNLYHSKRSTGQENSTLIVLPHFDLKNSKPKTYFVIYKTYIAQLTCQPGQKVLPKVRSFFALIPTKLILLTFSERKLFHNYSSQDVKFGFYTGVESLLSANPAKLCFRNFIFSSKAA